MGRSIAIARSAIRRKLRRLREARAGERDHEPAERLVDQHCKYPWSSAVSSLSAVSSCASMNGHISRIPIRYETGIKPVCVPKCSCSSCGPRSRRPHAIALSANATKAVPTATEALIGQFSAG